MATDPVQAYSQAPRHYSQWVADTRAKGRKYSYSECSAYETGTYIPNSYVLS